MNIHCLDWSSPCVWMNMHICTHIAVFSTGAIRATRILYQSWWYYLYSWQVSTWQAWHHYRHHCSYHHPMITSGWFVRCKVGWCGVIWKKVVCRLELVRVRLARVPISYWPYGRLPPPSYTRPEIASTHGKLFRGKQSTTKPMIFLHAVKTENNKCHCFSYIWWGITIRRTGDDPDTCQTSPIPVSRLPYLTGGHV